MYLNLGNGKYLNMDRVEEVRIGTGENGAVAYVRSGDRVDYHRGAEADTIRRYLECDSSVCVPPPAAPAVDVAAVRVVIESMDQSRRGDFRADWKTLEIWRTDLASAIGDLPPGASFGLDSPDEGESD